MECLIKLQIMNALSQILQTEKGENGRGFLDDEYRKMRRIQENSWIFFRGEENNIKNERDEIRF